MNDTFDLNSTQIWILTCVFFSHPPFFFPNAKHRAAVPLTLKGTLLVLAPSLFVLDATSFKRENLPPQSVTWFRWSRCSFGTGHLGDIRDSHVFSARQNTLNENNWTCVNEDFQLERMKTCHIYIYIYIYCIYPPGNESISPTEALLCRWCSFSPGGIC